MSYAIYRAELMHIWKLGYKGDIGWFSSKYWMLFSSENALTINDFQQLLENVVGSAPKEMEKDKFNQYVISQLEKKELLFIGSI